MQTAITYPWKLVRTAEAITDCTCPAGTTGKQLVPGIGLAKVSPIETERRPVSGTKHDGYFFRYGLIVNVTITQALAVAVFTQRGEVAQRTCRQ